MPLNSVAQPLEDRFNRRFAYIRLSITDVCNFRCPYCLPNGYTCTTPAEQPLTVDEIANLMAALVEMGVRKVRLTGGEPTLRPDLLAIARLLASFPQIETLAMTTNGFRLRERVQTYADAGINHLNVSIDSLSPKVFAELTGKNSLTNIIAGIDKALDLPFQAIKINTVLMRGINDDTAPFIEWLRTRPVSLRFIELMPTQDNTEFFKLRHIKAEELRLRLERGGWLERVKTQLGGPARVFGHPEVQGSIGFIEPYARNFCTGCNRLRITANGELRLCLFGDRNYTLRPLLQSPTTKRELQDTLISVLRIKEQTHHLEKGDYGSTKHFASIGG